SKPPDDLTPPLHRGREPMDIVSERRQLQQLRAIEIDKLQVLQDEVAQYERDAATSGAFAPGYSEARYGRDVQARAVAQLDGRLESLERRRTNLINGAFVRLALRHYPDSDRLYEIAVVS